MSSKVKVLRDKHKSPTSIYPKVLDECLPANAPIKWTSKTKGNFTGKFYFDEWDVNALAPAIIIEKDTTHKAEIRVWGNNVLDNDVYGIHMSYQEGGSKYGTVEITKDGINISGINIDVNINTTGTGKFYINGVEYQAGGGSQLYQHNIRLYDSNLGLIDIYIQIFSSDNTQFTKTSLLNWLNTNGFTTSNAKWYGCSGVRLISGGGLTSVLVGIAKYSDEDDKIRLRSANYTGGGYVDRALDNTINIEDTVIAL